MKLNDKVYDLLKYLGMIGLPAVAVAYQSLAQVWSLPYSEQIPSTILIIVTTYPTNVRKGDNSPHTFPVSRPVARTFINVPNDINISSFL